jgi:hypothetical protein
MMLPETNLKQLVFYYSYSPRYYFDHFHHIYFYYIYVISVEGALLLWFS